MTTSKFITFTLFCLLFCTIITPQLVNSDRWALIVTLAGTKKLNEYFEWSCRSIGASSDLLDMLVFHEGNERLKQMTCANNVKMINLGENGLAKLITSQIIGGSNSTMSESNRRHLTMLLSNIIVHIPRYLVEIKPMTGILFQDYLSLYSHWSYTDPDIIWGSLSNWMDLRDTQDFDIVTLCKTLDAGRLFLRGQFALHKNIPRVNNLYTQLKYFQPENFAQRIAEASSLLSQGKESEYIFYKCFHSAEGWYSIIAFTTGYNNDDSSRSSSSSSNSKSISQISTSKMNSNLLNNYNNNNYNNALIISHTGHDRNTNNQLKDDVSIKLISRGLDDFDLSPVILFNGVLRRCKRNQLEQCIAQTMNTTIDSSSSSSSNGNNKNNVGTNTLPLLPSSLISSSSFPSVLNLPQLVPIKVEAYYDTEECNMQWLPDEVRYCIAKPFYTKDNKKRKNSNKHSNSSNKNAPLSIRISRIGEVFSYSSSSSSSLHLGDTQQQQQQQQQRVDSNGNIRQWYANDEMVSRRQVADFGAFFHFRHWDDFASVRTRTIWEEKSDGSDVDSQGGAHHAGDIHCMVLQITSDQTMAFEPCDVVTNALALADTTTTTNIHSDHKDRNSHSNNIDNNNSNNNNNNSNNANSSSGGNSSSNDNSNNSSGSSNSNSNNDNARNNSSNNVISISSDRTKDLRLRKKKLKEALERREVVNNKNNNNNNINNSDNKKNKRRKSSSNSNNSDNANEVNGNNNNNNNGDNNNNNNNNNNNENSHNNADPQESILDSLQQRLKQARRKNEVSGRKKKNRFRSQS